MLSQLRDGNRLCDLRPPGALAKVAGSEKVKYSKAKKERSLMRMPERL